jgi:hypothetical protein
VVCLEAAESAVLFAYLVLFLYYLGRAFRQLRARKYRCLFSVLFFREPTST